jgi:hypothetical protein
MTQRVRSCFAFRFPSFARLQTPHGGSVSPSSTAIDRCNAGPQARGTRKGALLDRFVQVNIEIAKTAPRAIFSIVAQSRCVGETTGTS